MLVVDASAVTKLLVPEQGSELVQRLWSEEVEWHAPTLVVPEVAAAVAAARIAGRLDGAEALRGQDLWASLASEVTLHVLDEQLARSAGELSRRGGVRGADAVYLATCELLAEADPVALVSFDLRRRAAAAHVPGLRVIPADT